MGSPTEESSPGWISASEQSAIAVAISVGASVYSCTTVILFWVSVPVLSVQMIWVQPRVSTAVSLRISAWCFAMSVTPMDSTMVTTAGRPSGIAATASAMAATRLLTALAPSIFHENGASDKMTDCTQPTAKTTTQMPMTSFVRKAESWAMRRCSGVCSFSAMLSAPAILPISVSMPVAVTTPVPRP